MNMEVIFTIAVIAAYAYGFCRGWKQLTKKEGFLANHLPEKAMVWLNKKKAGSIAAKIGVSCLLAYLFAAAALLTAGCAFVKMIFRFLS